MKARALVFVGCLIAFLAVTLERSAEAGGVKSMVFPGKDWIEATPESQGVDSTKLNEALRYLANHCGKDQIKETAIIRNGYLVWKGSNIDRRHPVWSCTKSFTSTVLGLLIEDGKCTLDTLARDYVPGLARHYPRVTLRHFATMTSGYDAEGGGYGKSDPLDGSRTPFVPTTRLFAPGAKFGYWDDAMNEFGNVLTHIAGESLRDLFKRRIADAIGMNNWSWGSIGTTSRAWLVNGAAGNLNKGINISARDLGRFGLLFLNRGVWNGKRLLSASWVGRATSVQVPASTEHNAISERQKRIDGRGVYGLNWWVNGVKPDGRRQWPGAPAATYAASGYNHNKCFVIPEWKMVVVRLGTDGSPAEADAVWGTFFHKLGEAIKQTPVMEQIGGKPKKRPVPLIRAHSHNDYQHPRPLLDALDQGFCSVEADIHLVDGKLLVAHDRDKVKSGRTLESLYLEPLRRRIRKNAGRVYREGPELTLLIDVKSDAESTYAVLRHVLKQYSDILTVFRGTGVSPVEHQGQDAHATETKAVTAILSGNRPRETLAAESVRYCAMDGRLSDLDSDSPVHLIPLISDSWGKVFQWRGSGAMPEGERRKLKRIVEKVHKRGCRVRFWGTPDTPAVWRETRAAGVDLINTDDLAGLQKFLLADAPNGE